MVRSPRSFMFCLLSLCAYETAAVLACLLQDTLRDSFAAFDRSGEGLVPASALLEVLKHAWIDVDPVEVRVRAYVFICTHTICVDTGW